MITESLKAMSSFEQSDLFISHMVVIYPDFNIDAEILYVQTNEIQVRIVN
jgi:hypothetical protein